MPDIVIGPDARLQASHDIRSKFEKYALSLLLTLLVAYVLIMLAGVVWRPAGPHAADWGSLIVQRAVAIKDSILTVCESLASVLGITMTRGHFDARLTRGDQ
jgi:hypothetical protein